MEINQSSKEQFESQELLEPSSLLNNPMSESDNILAGGIQRNSNDIEFGNFDRVPDKIVYDFRRSSPNYKLLDAHQEYVTAKAQGNSLSLQYLATYGNEKPGEFEWQ